MGKTYKSFDLFQKDFQKNTKKIIDKLEDEMEDIGDDIIELIQNRTWKGYGVDANEGSKEKLKPLDPNYKIWRAKKHRGSKGEHYSKNKSNLTLTGSMLNSLEADVTKSNLSLRVIPSGVDSTGASNIEKARGHEEGIKRKDGSKVKRPFLYLSRIEIKRLTKDIRVRVSRIIDKLF